MMQGNMRPERHRRSSHLSKRPWPDMVHSVVSSQTRPGARHSLGSSHAGSLQVQAELQHLISCADESKHATATHTRTSQRGIGRHRLQATQPSLGLGPARSLWGPPRANNNPQPCCIRKLPVGSTQSLHIRQSFRKCWMARRVAAQACGAEIWDRCNCKQMLDSQTCAATTMTM
eukprot:11079403-Alexandrium_andersonii.AAC.1